VPPTESTRDAGFPTLVAAAREGSPDALTDLFRTYQPRLLRYLRAQERGMADDLAADVWEAVAGGLSRFDGDEAGFRSWLFTIARNRLIGHRRTIARRRTDPVAHHDLNRTDEWGWGADPAWLVVRQLGVQQTVEALVAGLPPDQSEVILLRVVAGLDVADVARITNRSPGSVRVTCHRALRRLATHVDAEALAE
jgi:RNA polymerase sigma-70 factor, ECF subfamily